MKYILPFKLFEDEVNRYGYSGKIIDISRTELEECVNCLNKHLQHLYHYKDDKLVDVDSYQGGQSSSDRYALAAQFTNDISVYDRLTDRIAKTGIIVMLGNCLFNDFNSIKLLSRDGNYHAHGYSVVFTNDEDFTLRFIHRASKVKVPDSKEEVLKRIIQQYITYLAVMGDKVMVDNTKHYAPVFKDLLENYFRYLLDCKKDLFTQEITKDEVNKVVFNTITSSSSAYDIFNGMKKLYPNYYKELSKYGNIHDMDTAANMGDRGFNESVNDDMEDEVREYQKQFMTKSLRTYIPQFDKLFSIIGIDAHNVTISGRNTLSIYYQLDNRIMSTERKLKGGYYTIIPIFDYTKLDNIIPINTYGKTESLIRIYFTNDKEDYKSMRKYIHEVEGRGRTTAPKEARERKLCMDTGNDDKNFKLIVRALRDHFKMYISDKMGENLSSNKVEIHFPMFRNIVIRYCNLILDNNYTEVPLEKLYKIIYDEFVDFSGNASMIKSIQETKPELYAAFMKINPEGIKKLTNMGDKGFGD